MTGRAYFPLLTEAFVPSVTAGVITLAPNYSVPLTELSQAILIAPNAGVAGFIDFTIGGTYAVGDEVRVTITSNITNRQLWRKSYVHTVQAGATSNTAIAAAIAALIAADTGSNSPYASAVSAGAVVTVTQLDDDKKGLVSYEYTDSAAGTIAAAATPTVISEGQPSDLVDRGVEAADINLASYDTVRITLKAEAAIPFIDSSGATVKEIYWYGTPGNGAGLVALIP